MSWRDTVDEWRERARAEASRLKAELRAAQAAGNFDTSNPADALALAELVRPNLGDNTPEPVRRFLEPVIATAAMIVLAVLFAVGALNLAMFVVVAGAVYAILTYVFGIQLDLNVPG